LRNGVVKIGDFGVARSKGDLTISIFTSFIGTLDYISPEMEIDNRYTYSTDMWYNEKYIL
jgi:serine/threonine protein kinase